MPEDDLHDLGITVTSARACARWGDEAADQRQDRIIYIEFETNPPRLVIGIAPAAGAQRGRKIQLDVPIKGMIRAVLIWFNRTVYCS
jgi:hypothetical protein